MPVHSSVEEAISQSTAEIFKVNSSKTLAGGSISQSKCITGKDGRKFFCKENDLRFLPFFEVEAVALKQIKTTNTIRVPNVITFGKTASSSFLVLEFIDEGSTSPKGQELMGKQLASMHKKEQPFSAGKKTIALALHLSQTQSPKIGWISTASIACNISYNLLLKKVDPLIMQRDF